MKKRWILCGIALIVLTSVFARPAYAADFPRQKLISSKFFNESQMIIVEANGWDTKYAKLSTYEKVNGVWKKALGQMPAMLGYNGFAKVMKEGGGASPTGIYNMGLGFGWAAKPANSKYSYRVTTAYDYWVDDVTSPDYNKWIYYSGNPNSRWKSFERMNHPLYKYGAVIKYNENPIVKGKGSAIFLHMWKSSTSATAGCVAVSEANMKTLLTWMDSKKKPVIVMGPSSEIDSYLYARNEKLQKVDVVVNGVMQNYDQPAVAVDGMTLAPFRGIGETLGAKVEWNAETGTVKAELDGTVVELKYLSNVAKVNGVNKTLDAAPISINNRIVVPVRFIAEAFGADVKWDGSKHAVMINKK
ncbi:stalk domain-containing protein [Fictibacillus phosphorivorans]|uniref:stalk domain-containing protein n=1 Tax=Fictibacillus phosphorivorans TaxID=1221500 RepID=UPI00203FB75E|nr:stalk domain-containing protein [Fictibacillus phosphorivorans]MCM3718532.1 stalk domain-containing protein [Fictibacillus phosphorivorans]MCM3776112.1 stalk domain-containing protein [Fictibacillus phosphorivorans]